MQTSFGNDNRHCIKLFLWVDKKVYERNIKDYSIKNIGLKPEDILDEYILNLYNQKYSRKETSLIYSIGLLNHHKLFSYLEYLSIIYKYAATHINNKKFSFNKDNILLEINVPIKETNMMVFEVSYYLKMKSLLNNTDENMARNILSNEADKFNNIEKQMRDELGENYPLYTFDQLGYVLIPCVYTDWIITARTIDEVMFDVYHEPSFTQDMKGFLLRKCSESLGKDYKYFKEHPLAFDGYNGRNKIPYIETVQRPIDVVVPIKKIR